jgi:hypothetical protein
MPLAPEIATTDRFTISSILSLHRGRNPALQKRSSLSFVPLEPLVASRRENQRWAIILISSGLVLAWTLMAS